jgi:hypothetical protein
MAYVLEEKGGCRNNMPSQKLEKDIEMYKLAINLLEILDYEDIIINKKLTINEMWASKAMRRMLNEYLKLIDYTRQLKADKEKLTIDNVRLMKKIGGID